MKRYRILGFDYDTRCEILKICSENPVLNEQNKSNLNKVRLSLKSEFGEKNFEQKIQNLLEIGSKSMSIVAYHNEFLTQIRTSYVMGSYYPALTGACALGERILNHLLLNLRTNFKDTVEYKTVYKKNSFDNWNTAIITLKNWEILLPEAVKKFKELAKKRNQSIHFNLNTEVNIKHEALKAILLLQGIIDEQFSAFGNKPWFLTSTPGEIYIKKSWEEHPYIKLIYLPNSILLGYKHKIISIFPWKVNDQFTYDPTEITDEQFSELRKMK